MTLLRPSVKDEPISGTPPPDLADLSDLAGTGTAFVLVDRNEASCEAELGIRKHRRGSRAATAHLTADRSCISYQVITMPRAPAYSHDQLMAATYDVLRRNGPVGLSLRPIAARLGVSQPALSKRIGSKHALLADMQRWATEKTRLLVAELRRRELVAGLRWLFRVFARQVRSPRELAHLLSFSTLCLADPKLRGHADARHRLLTSGVAAALRRAGRPRAGATARALVALLDGVPLTWAIQPRGSLERALLESLDVVLGVRSTR